MNAAAISNVTKAFRERLERAIADPDSNLIRKVFTGPLDDPDANDASLVLFLYRVTPNAALRNREHRVPWSNPPPAALVFRNALPLDLYYLLTVGTTPGANNEEPLLEVLGLAMQALQADPELIGPTVGYETVHVSLEPLTTEETSRVWQLFPTANYRTSVAYVATPVWLDPPPPYPPSTAKEVLEDELRAGGKAVEGAEAP